MKLSSTGKGAEGPIEVVIRAIKLKGVVAMDVRLAPGGFTAGCGLGDVVSLTRLVLETTQTSPLPNGDARRSATF